MALSQTPAADTLETLLCLLDPTFCSSLSNMDDIPYHLRLRVDLGVRACLFLESHILLAILEGTSVAPIS